LTFGRGYKVKDLLINLSPQEQSPEQTISEYELSEIDKADSQNYEIQKDLSTPVTPH